MDSFDEDPKANNITENATDSQSNSESNSQNNSNATETTSATEECYNEYLNDGELYFEVVGPEDDFSAPLLFLHGGPGYNSYSFRELCGEQLLHRTVIYADMRGCGRSGALADEEVLDLDTLIADVEAIREFLELDEIIPLGHGFGALVALEYTRRFAEFVPKVVLVNPWVHFPELAGTLLELASRLSEHPLVDPADEIRAQTPADQHPAFGNARIEKAFELVSAYDLLNATHFKDSASRMHLEFVDAESQLLAGAAMQQALVRRGLWEFEYPPFLFDITRPVHVISGQYDHGSYPRQSDWLTDLANASLTVLDTGHYPWLDDIDGFCEVLETLCK